MAPHLHAWRGYPSKTNFNPISVAAKRLNTRFTSTPLSHAHPKKTNHPEPFKCRMGTKGLMAGAEVMPVVAGLGTLLGTLLGKYTHKKEESARRKRCRMRVAAQIPILLALTTGHGDAWRRKLWQASTEQLRALTDLISNLYDGVVPDRTKIKLHLKKHKSEGQWLSALRTPLHEQCALLLSLEKGIVTFKRAVQDA